MGIHQYTISFIPKRSLIEKFGRIPDQLFINHQARIDFIKSGNWDKKFDFEDDISILWWKDLRIEPGAIEAFIYSFTEPDRFFESDDLKRYSDSNSNDLTVCLVDGKYIEDISCRIDIVNQNRFFIDRVLLLANKLECLILDKEGYLFEPVLEKLAENAKRFRT